MLSNSLAYEADSHIGIYPIFLRSMAYIDELEIKDKDNLQKMSEMMWENGYSGVAEERDMIFYKKIINAVNEGYKNILAIVGA